MQQWDEYKASASCDSSENIAKASSSREKVYTKASTKASSTAKKTYSYSRSSGWGYINGMDCWAMSDYIASKYNGR